MVSKPIEPNKADKVTKTRAPQDISSHGWKDIALRTWSGSNKKNISLIAGGVTFYILMALAPGFASLVSLYGLIANPHQIDRQVNILSGLLRRSELPTINHQLHLIVATSPRALGVGAILGTLVAGYTASRGMGGMIAALDIAYGQDERRGLIRFYLTALGLVVGGVISLMLVGALTIVALDLNADRGVRWLLLIAGLPALFLFMSGMLALLYHYGPDRPATRWQWTPPGAVTASLLWVIGTALIYIYVSNFGDYNKIYGSLSAVMVFLSWLWFSIYIVLLGAEINAEAERQAVKGKDVQSLHAP